MGKGLQRTVLAVLFLVGLAIFSYPHVQGLLVKREMESTVQTFQEQKETQPTTSVVISDSTQPSEQRLYPESDRVGGDRDFYHSYRHGSPGRYSDR